VIRAGDETVWEMWSLLDAQDVLDEVEPAFSHNIRAHVERGMRADPFHVSANTDPKGNRSRRRRTKTPTCYCALSAKPTTGSSSAAQSTRTAAAYANQACTKPTIGNWGDAELSEYAVGFIVDMGARASPPIRRPLKSTSSPTHPRHLQRVRLSKQEARMTMRLGYLSLREVVLMIVLAPLAVPVISAAASTPPPASQLAPTYGRYAPSIDPANFVRTIDNPYLPFKPGTAFHFRGVKGKTPQTDDEVVLHRTKRILGVRSTVVRDTVSEHGRPVERTFDWYAQDKGGNVWYMGEDSLELHHGRFVKASDSWESGVNGAKPGIIMPGHPRPGDAYRQEYYPPGNALDVARVVGFRGSVTVPYGSFKRPLITLERSPLEPQTEKKYYVRGVGEVKEQVVAGHHEVFRLVGVTR
jgi:hypothetical protein